MTVKDGEGQDALEQRLQQRESDGAVGNGSNGDALAVSRSAAVADDDDDDEINIPPEKLDRQEEREEDVIPSSSSPPLDIVEVREMELVDAVGRVGVYSGQVAVVPVDDGWKKKVPHGRGIMRYRSNHNCGGASAAGGRDGNNSTVLKYDGNWDHGHWDDATDYSKVTGNRVTVVEGDEGEEENDDGDEEEKEIDLLSVSSISSGRKVSRVWMTNGDTYCGNFRRSQKHGKYGQYHWSDGRVYKGQYENDQRHGRGKYVWNNRTNGNKTFYVGSFLHNQRHGSGKFVDAVNGIEYVGEFESGVYHGRGRYRKIDGDVVFEGQFVNGRPAGTEGPESQQQFVRSPSSETMDASKLSANDRDANRSKNDPGQCVVVVNDYTWHDTRWSGNVVATYRGLWDATQHAPTGHGTAIYRNHIDFDSYEGCFDSCGHFHGQGRLTFLNGDMYEGNFEVDKRDGFGCYKWKDGRQYRGEFSDNKRHGQGTFLYPNDDIYEGAFVHGKREGYGRFVFHNGSVYEGEWKDGLYHGRGRLVDASGKTISGTFAGGLAHGPATESGPDGSVTFVGKWRQGKPVNDIDDTDDVVIEEEKKDNVGKEVPLDDVKTSLTIPDLEVSEEQNVIAASSVEQGAVTDKRSSFCSVGSAGGPPSPSVASLSTTEEIISERESAQTVIETDLQPRVPAPAAAPPFPPKQPHQPISPPIQPECEAVVDEAITDAQGNPGKYTGIVLKGTRQPHGVGRIVYSDGKRIHEGFWRDGKKEGHGRCLFFPQGDFHEGEYKNNLRHGPGRYQWKDGRSYVGEYVDDLRDGKGFFRYPNGDHYNGYFEKGQRSGFGRFEFGSNCYFEGLWKDGKYNGKGVLVWDDGRFTYEGEFLAGRFHGHGKRTDASGTLVEGRWINGRFENDSNDNCSPTSFTYSGDAYVTDDDSIHDVPQQTQVSDAA